MSLVFLQSVGGEIEGRVFPVMGPLTVFEPIEMPQPTYRTRWRGQAKKLRNCDFVRVEWFLGPRDGRRVQVQFEFTDRPQVRPAGPLEWSGLVVALDPPAARSNSHADVLHQCDFRPWLTRTPFYDPPARCYRGT